jgi:palmitoyltransferase
MPRKVDSIQTTSPFTHDMSAGSNEEQLAAFRKRQEEDLKRHDTGARQISRRQPFHLRYGDLASNEQTEPNQVAHSESTSGEEAWRNSEGERLEDFGVDEVAEFYDEDDLPLAQLLARRRVGGSAWKR